MSKFTKGKSGNPTGRPKGAENRLTKTVKETVLAVFQDLQNDPKHNLTAFAQKHPRDFYQIAAKLIPTEIQGSTAMKIIVSKRKEQDADTGDRDR